MSDVLFVLLIAAACWYAATLAARVTREAEKTREAFQRYVEVLAEYDSKTAVIGEPVWDDDEVESMNHDLEAFGRVLDIKPVRLI